MVREQAIDEESIDDYENEWEETGDAKGVLNRDALVDRIGILEGVVVEGEMLVVWFEGVEDEESNHTSAINID